MNAIAINNPYQRQEFTVQPLPVAEDNIDRARQDPATRSLIVKTGEQTSGLIRKKNSDTIEFSDSAKDDSEGNNPSQTQSDNLRFDLPKMKNWDHKLVAWFRTALTVQGSMPQSRGLHINIII